jgi:hypothetical protein
MNAQRDLGSVAYIPLTRRCDPQFFFVLYAERGSPYGQSYGAEDLTIDAAVCSHDFRCFIDYYQWEIPSNELPPIPDDPYAILWPPQYQGAFYMDQDGKLGCWYVIWVCWQLPPTYESHYYAVFVNLRPDGTHEVRICEDTVCWAHWESWSEEFLVASPVRAIQYQTLASPIDYIFRIADSYCQAQVVRNDQIPAYYYPERYEYIPASGNTRYVIAHIVNGDDYWGTDPSLEVTAPGYGSVPIDLSSAYHSMVGAPSPPPINPIVYLSDRAPEGNIRWAAIIRVHTYGSAAYDALVYTTAEGAIDSINMISEPFVDKTPVGIVNGMLVWAPYKWYYEGSPPSNPWHNRMLLWSPASQREVPTRSPSAVIPQDVLSRIWWPNPWLAVVTPTPHLPDV